MTGLYVYSGDENKYITFGFNRKDLVLDNIKVNETIDLIKYLYWDTTFVYGPNEMDFCTFWFDWC